MGAEVKIHNTNPTRADSDGDGYNDNLEITANSDPNNAADIPATPPVDGPLVYYSFNKENGTDVENLGSLLTPGTLSGAATFGAGKDDDFWYRPFQGTEPEPMTLYPNWLHWN